MRREPNRQKVNRPNKYQTALAKFEARIAAGDVFFGDEFLLLFLVDDYRELDLEELCWLDFVTNEPAQLKVKKGG